MHSLTTYWYTVVTQVSAHGCLDITCDFGSHGCLPGMRLYRSCYIDPLKYGTWALARDTTVLQRQCEGTPSEEMVLNFAPALAHKALNSNFCGFYSPIANLSAKCCSVKSFHTELQSKKLQDRNSLLYLCIGVWIFLIEPYNHCQ